MKARHWYRVSRIEMWAAYVESTGIKGVALAAALSLLALWSMGTFK